MTGEHVHGPAVAVVAAVLMWSVRWLWRVRSARRNRRRLAAVVPLRPVPAAGRRPAVPGSARILLAQVGVGCAGWLLVGGLAGAGIGLAAGVALRRWYLRRASADGPARARVAADAARQLPLAADLLAACIEAGAGPVTAAQAVGETLGGPVGEALARGAAEVRLGGEPGVAWQTLAALPGASPLARLLERADVSGLPLALPAARLAAECRAGRAREGTARARRAAVAVTAPVGLCFLPAFVAIGVLPVVIGLAGGALGGGGG